MQRPYGERTKKVDMSVALKQKAFPYLVVATGIIICFGPSAMAINCAGIFFTPVSENLGVERPAFALYLTIMLLSTAFSLPILGKLNEHKDMRIMLSGAVVAVGISLIAMGFSSALWQFYIAGALMGTGFAQLCILAVPTLINRWFNKRVGFYVGLCMAFTGIGGMLFNLIGGYFIGSAPDGWRMAYVVFGVVALVMSLPFTILCVRSNPSDLGMLPVGLSASSEACDTVEAPISGVSAAKASKSAAFGFLVVFAAICMTTIGFYHHIPSYATSLTQFPAVAAIAAGLASAVMAGQAFGKIAIGIINDKFNVKIGMFFAMFSGMAGLIAMLLAPGYVAVMLVACFLFGIFYASGTVLIPLMTGAIFGQREYSQSIRE